MYRKPNKLSSKTNSVPIGLVQLRMNIYFKTKEIVMRYKKKQYVLTITIMFDYYN